MPSPTVRNNLPAELTSLIGRETSVQRLGRLVLDRRLVTLVGVGGSGKTRLAIAVARNLDESTDFDSTWFVDLAPLREPALISQAVLNACGLRATSEGPAERPLQEQLAQRHVLIVLDNCEHLVHECAALAGGILRSCPNVHMLATSREPLGVQGEVTWRVNPLPVPQPSMNFRELAEVESVHLFVDRARAVLPDFDLTQNNAAAVANVCMRLDGIPLALELAAVRIEQLTAAQISARLDDRFRLLARPDPMAPDRHQSLVSTVAWSYDLLSETEKCLFRRLAAFAGSFNLEAAEAVCSEPPLEKEKVFELVAGLIDKSLLTAGAEFRGERRYRMLETLREYASARLRSATDCGETFDRHARLFAAICTEANQRHQDPDAPAWYELLDEEMDNVRAALAWAADHERDLGLRMASGLAGFWDYRGWIAEGRHWLRSLLAEEPSVATPDYAAGLCAAGLLAWRQGDYSESARLFTTALDQARALNNRPLVARAASGLGDTLLHTGQSQEAAARFEEALQLFREERDMVGVARALNRIGAGYLHLQERYDESSSLIQEGMALCRQLNDRVGVANGLYGLGMNEVAAGRHARGRRYLKEALILREELGDRFGVAWCWMGLGSAAIGLGDLRTAHLEMTEAIRRCEDISDSWGLVLTCLLLVGLLVKAGMPEPACRLLGAAEAARTAIGGVDVAWLRKQLEGWLEEARRALSPKEAELALAVGEAMPLAGLGDYAVKCLAEVDAKLQSSRGPISRRESEVAALVAQGLTNRDIAQQLFISERTVDGHVQAILTKLEFRSRAQIASWVTERR